MVVFAEMMKVVVVLDMAQEMTPPFVDHIHSLVELHRARSLINYLDLAQAAYFSQKFWDHLPPTFHQNIFRGDMNTVAVVVVVDMVARENYCEND